MALAAGEARYETHAMLLDENELVLAQLAYGRCAECKIIHIDEFQFTLERVERILVNWNFEITWKD